MAFSGTPESLLTSTTAAFAGVMLVLYEQHVHFVWGDRATYTSVFHHKCGLTMLAGLAWAAFETVMFTAALLRERRQDQAHRERMRTLSKTKRASFPYAQAAQTSAP